jgi:mono/diheme cytochrome c family protein
MSVGAKFPDTGGCIVGVVALALIVHGIVQGTARAEPPDVVEPSAEKGQTLAERLCSGCHVVEAGADGTVPAGVPPFRTIANSPGQTSQRIMNVLIKPHAPMPDTHLSREEMLDIVAYLETLRTDQSIPPLLPPKKYGPKPKYPEPS